MAKTDVLRFAQASGVPLPGVPHVFECRRLAVRYIAAVPVPRFRGAPRLEVLGGVFDAADCQAVSAAVQSMASDVAALRLADVSREVKARCPSLIEPDRCTDWARGVPLGGVPHIFRHENRALRFVGFVPRRGLLVPVGEQGRFGPIPGLSRAIARVSAYADDMAVSDIVAAVLAACPEILGPDHWPVFQGLPLSMLPLQPVHEPVEAARVVAASGFKYLTFDAGRALPYTAFMKVGAKVERIGAVASEADAAVLSAACVALRPFADQLTVDRLRREVQARCPSMVVPAARPGRASAD